MLASSCLVDLERLHMVSNSGNSKIDFCTKAGTPRHEILLRKLWEPASEGLSDRVLPRWVFSKNMGKPPKSSILIGFSIINHPFWDTPILGNTHMFMRYRVDFCFGKLVNREVSVLCSVAMKHH